MSVFVDTGVFYAQHDEDANRHDVATASMSTVLEGRFGKPMTSDYVYDETVTLARSRFGNAGRAIAAGDRILGRGEFPDAIELLFVGREAFDDAIETVTQYDDQRLSFTDAATIALIERHDIDHVLSFDGDFDGIVDRLDPETL